MSRVYAVASGKGGVGKTTTVANLGAVLAEGGHETVVVDADLGMGNLAGVLGVDVDAGPTVNDVLAGTATVDAAIREGPVGLSVLPVSDDLDDFATGDPGALSTLLDDLDTEIVLLDTSAGLSHDSVEPLRVVDEVVLVSTAERGALGDTAKTREVADRFGTPVWGAVATRASAGKGEGRSRGGRSQGGDAGTVADRLGVTVRGTVPDDPAVSAAAEAGEPLVTAAPNAPATDAYRRLAVELVGDDSLGPAAADEPASGPTADADGVVVADAEKMARDGETDAAGIDEEAGIAVGAEDSTDDTPAAAMDRGDTPSDDDSDDEEVVTVESEDDDGSERTGFLRWLLG
ncbi:P-loop NTPase [Haloplanus pelagicus]|jgi:septum site-determining protein MinD|uniref:P-loop NTPase n=1 Tax=Haloplanus pelagicus TaxID=2949995 RepID=UPI0020404092|nr:P-loop NTPase [Haloplanus sp. HW8-1]